MVDEERYEADARDWLDGVDVPPTRLEVAQIIHIGRSQVRRRRLLTAGGLVAVLATVAAIPATVPLLSQGGGLLPGWSGQLPVLECDITKLPLPDELAEPEEDAYPDVEVAAIDPTGRYVVGVSRRETETGSEGSEPSPNPNWIVVWDDGSPTAISSLRDHATATDVNSAGVVVGYGWDGPDSDYSWIYHDGEMSELPVPEGYVSAEAVAINSVGDVVGTVMRDFDRRSVVVWPADDLGNPHVLAGPPNLAVRAKGISDDGMVVGGVYTAGLHDGAYLWAADGTGQAVSGPEGAIDVTVWAARGTWAAGNALMSVPASDFDYELTVVWDLSAGTFELLDPGTVATVSDVSAAGDVLYAEAIVLRDGEPYALPDPIDEGVVVTLLSTFFTRYVSADGITDDGSTIVGSASINDTPGGRTDAIYPVMWRC